MKTNNRQLKFRVWDKISNKFIFPSFGYDIVGNSGDITKGIYYTHCIGLTWKEEVKDRHDIKNFIFQQFTGLKDRDGQEIYEGDILETSTGFRITVKWSNDGQWKCYRVDKTVFSQLWNCSKIYPIVGNTFKNPELL